MLLVVANDVANNRRRRRLRYLLVRNGTLVQAHAFERERSAEQAHEVKRRVHREIKQARVRGISDPLRPGCRRNAENEGGQRHPPTPLVIVV